ncbi:MAG: protein translocase subunit SecD [Gaiellaceae bacterium]
MSDRRRYLVLIGLIVVAVAGVAYMAIPGSPGYRKATLGLDLQGGLEVVLKAVPQKGQQVTAAGMQIAQDIMRNRVDKLGAAAPDVRRQGADQMTIQLAGIKDTAVATQLIGKTAKLQFFDLENDLTGPSKSVQGAAIPEPSIFTLLSTQQASLAKTGASSWYLFDAKTKKLIAGPLPTKTALFTTKKAKALGIRTSSASGTKAKYRAFGLPTHTTLVSCGGAGAVAVVCPNASAATTSWYLFKFNPQNGQGTVKNPVPELTGDQLQLSGTRADIDPSTNQPVVLMQFTSNGSKAFQRITKSLYERGTVLHSPQHFAIVLDGQIASFPQIDYTDSSLANGISGNAQITGIGSFTEAKNLALVLQTGSLPYNFKTIESTNVSATLGKDSLAQAKRAAIGGLIAVVVFLILLYRFLGLIAVLGLAIYAALLYGAILLFNVTLTLPGFAGLILTIGVAADANVVVFERIKEEVRSGKSVRAAISAGYAKGFHTILDANVVTCITALVLFAVAVADVKGFALMLLIGTVISLLTAVAATRAMLGLLAGFRWFDSPAFMGAHGTQGLKFLHIDYMRRRYLWFAISGVIIVVSAVSLGVRGLNLGIDFKGGTQISFESPTPTPLSSVRTLMKTDGEADAIVQGRGKQTGAESYTAFQVRTKSLSPAQETKIQNGLDSQFHAKAFGVKNVSSSFGRQIARDAILAILFSLFLVVVYIAIRFDVKFAVPVIIAMIHDVLITVGVYSVTGREVTTSTVAAVLTVLGYSIYDTIIIFDRIRENIPLMRRSPFATITNISLWETIRRSLATTFITLLPVASLLFFGGSTLKDFAFALMVGVASGAYSSIFIAAPLLTIWKEREPEFERRVEHANDDHDERLLAQAEHAAAAEPAPEVTPVGAVGRAVAANEAKRERRRQRRRSRPHGRAR